MTIKNLCPLMCLLTFLAGCDKQKYEDFLEPEPINLISHSDSDEDSKDVYEGPNLLMNGGLENTCAS